MKIKHLIIPKNVANYAMEFSNQICEFKWNYEYGDTHCNNLVWRQFMYPEMKKIQTMLKKKNWHDAFGSLFGIYLFDRKDGGHWIHDQEEYDDMTNFSAWFRKYCSSWKKLLEQSDEEIGLICKGGLPTGYRETLMYILQRQQDDLNTNVLDTFDEFSSRKIRINIVKNKPEKENAAVKKKYKQADATSSKKAKVE